MTSCARLLFDGALVNPLWRLAGRGQFIIRLLARNNRRIYNMSSRSDGGWGQGNEASALHISQEKCHRRGGGARRALRVLWAVWK